jgi:acrylyl-CoA reductase (NADPH)
MTYQALHIHKDDAGYRCTLQTLDDSALPEGDVTVQVDYSTINYKDGLAITGKSPVVRKFPLTPGIDLAGTVTESQHPLFKVGDPVVLNGWGVGESHSGGLAQKARLKGDWLVKLPAAFSPRQAMAIGTAGYTAMLCVMALQQHGVTPDKGDILVTGAGGGVGSVAIALLAKLGYRVVASTGRLQEADYLRQLGAADVMDRAELSAPGKPLAKERWAGVVDSVGGATLANCVASLRMRSAVASCGNAGGVEFACTVLPFLLRGASILGIDSVMCPKPRRLEAWKRLTELLPAELLESMTTEARLVDLPELGGKILKGEIRGRLVVDPNR